MTLWWIGNVVLLVVVLPIVVVLLNGVLQAAKAIVPTVQGIATTAAAGSKDLDAAAAAADHAGAGHADGRGHRRLRRLARRDPRRRGGAAHERRGRRVMILAVVLIVLALVYFLVSTIFELRKIVAGLDEVIVHVGGIVEKSAPVNDVVDDDQRAARRRRLRARGPARQEGRHDATRSASSRACTRAPPPRACATSPRARRSMPPRIGEVYTKGTLTLARLGREAPIAAGQPGGRRAAQRRGRQPRGALALPERPPHEPGELPRSPVIGTDSPEQYEQREDIGAPRKRLPAKRS